MGREVVTGIVYSGVDRGATKVMKSVGKAAAGLRDKLSGMGKHVQSMPGAFGASAAAMMMMQGPMGQMGGKAADSANKLAALAAIAATGGPLGIGIAAISGLLMAGTAIWGENTEEVRKAAEKQKDLVAKVDESIKSLRAQRDAMRDVIDTFGKWGETVAQTTVRVLGEHIKAQEASNLALGAEVQARKVALSFKEKDLKVTEEQGVANLNAAYGLDVTIEGLEREAAALRDKVALDVKAVAEGEAALQLLYDKEAKELEANRRREESAKLEAKTSAATRRRGDTERLIDEKKRERRAALLAQYKADRAAEEAAEKAALDSRLSAIDRFVQERDRLRQQDLKKTELAAQQRIALEEQVARTQAAAMAANAQSIATNAMAAVEAEREKAKAAERTAKLSEAFARSAAKQVIDILALQASAAAAEKVYEAVAFPYNIPLSVIAGAAAYAAISGIGAQLNRGGRVPGTGNRDTVPAMLTPGEVVMSRGQVAALKALMANLGAPTNVQRNVADRAGGAGPSAAGGGQTFNTQIVAQQMFPDQAVSLKAMRRQSRTVERLQRQGMFPRGAEG